MCSDVALSGYAQINPQSMEYLIVRYSFNSMPLDHIHFFTTIVNLMMDTENCFSFLLYNSSNSRWHTSCALNLVQACADTCSVCMFAHFYSFRYQTKQNYINSGNVESDFVNSDAFLPAGNQHSYPLWARLESEILVWEVGALSIGYRPHHVVFINRVWGTVIGTSQTGRAVVKHSIPFNCVCPKAGVHHSIFAVIRPLTWFL